MIGLNEFVVSVDDVTLVVLVVVTFDKLTLEVGVTVSVG